MAWKDFMFVTFVLMLLSLWPLLLW